MKNRLLRLKGFLAILVLAVAVTGCSRHQELPDALQEYHSRMARVLETDGLEITFVHSHAFPTKQSMFIRPQDVSINVREFLTLPECRLNTIIAERNTALGKTQLPSQRYVYEVSLLTALKECIAATPSADMREKLNTLLSVKQQNLPINYSNLLAISEEIYLSLTQSPGFISGNVSDGFNETHTAWKYLTTIDSKSVADVDSSRLENELKTVEQFRLLARQWRSQKLLFDWLTASNIWLSAHIDDWQCKSLQQQRKATTLRNVFSLFFVEKIQPIASQINHYHYQLIPIMEKLITDPSIEKTWRESINLHLTVRHEQYREALMEHINIWQALFKKCGLAPGRPS